MVKYPIARPAGALGFQRLETPAMERFEERGSDGFATTNRGNHRSADPLFHFQSACQSENDFAGQTQSLENRKSGALGLGHCLSGR